MEKRLFTDNWTFKKKGDDGYVPVILPHDAMIHEKRKPDAEGGGAHAYFPGGIYLYEKRFFVPAEWEKKTVTVEFEGIYRNAKVSINGSEAGGHAYGYVPFAVCMDSWLKYGQENVITVEVDNSKLPNSRWYSGSGIYRPVNLFLAGKEHISYQGVRMTTLSCEPAKILAEVFVEGRISSAGEETLQAAEKETSIRIEIKEPEADRTVAAVKGVLEDGKFTAEIEIPEAKLWSDENPYLYESHVVLERQGEILDQMTERFGIRTVSWNSGGLFINGKRTLLKGGCIHHDNGILGTATWEKSEERRVRIMKEHGFNAIRSSHNPASEALLRACDKYGMYLMDETFDMWYVRKSKYDYGLDFKKWWKADTKAMVDRDYNHPSVIMYSIGNEVSEPGKPEGVSQGKEMIAFVKELDSSRAVTGGMNLMIMGNYAKGKGQYDKVDKDEGRKKPENESGKEPKNASLVFNMMATLVGPGMNKAANSDKVDKVTTPILDALDIAGYNYASGRYGMEGKKHPDRTIVGSETFPYEIYKNWEMVKKHPYLIGDFMWTSWDYLGEVGLGAWSYTGGMPFNRPYPWILGGAGVIDILGNPDASCKYAEVVWEHEKNPVIGVRPVNHPGVRVSKSVWRGTNAMESWSWRNCEGNKAVVEVYAKGESVQLLVNGKAVGRKKLKENKAIFKTKYQHGTVTAIVYDAAGNEAGKSTLSSAEGKNRIRLETEETVVKAGEIVYIPVSIAGENGVIESNADERLAVDVQGGVLLAFGSANPCTEEQYDSGSFTTYYGRALAIVYAPCVGEIRVGVAGDTLGLEETVIQVIG